LSCSFGWHAPRSASQRPKSGQRPVTPHPTAAEIPNSAIKFGSQRLKVATTAEGGLTKLTFTGKAAGGGDMAPEIVMTVPANSVLPKQKQHAPFHVTLGIKEGESAEAVAKALGKKLSGIKDLAYSVTVTKKGDEWSVNLQMHMMMRAAAPPTK
jgi:hypothetical protein